jgi:hypothetical protein
MAKKSKRSKPVQPVNSPGISGGLASGIDHFTMAEAMFNAASSEDVVFALSGLGISESQIRYEIDRAQKNPWFHVANRYAGRAAKLEWVADFPYRLGGASTAPQIPVVHKINPHDFFEQYYCVNRPVLLTGLADGWPAFDRWSLDYLDHLLGDRTVGVQWNRESDPDYEANCYDHKAELPLRDIIARLKAGPSNDFYITANNSDINKVALMPLWEDIGQISGMMELQSAQDGYFWMGPQGSLTPWHHDLSNNLLLQIKGRKRIRLVAAQDTHRMRNHMHCFTRYSAEELLPGPATVERPAVYEAVVEPGAALFIPVGWWHHVEGLDVTISLTFLNFAAPNDFESNYRSFGPI